jgi:anti-anti-sigma regulatory factor
VADVQKARVAQLVPQDMEIDIGLAVDTYIHARETTMRKQQEAIRELSTPVLQIRERLLLLPIIGVIDTHRARLITDGLLHSIRETRAKVVVMDVTGVATIDTRVANHLIQTVTAARLMGAQVIVTGLSSDVAQALVGLGLDLDLDLGKLTVLMDALLDVGKITSGRLELTRERLDLGALPLDGGVAGP